MDKPQITAYLKTQCGWSRGVRAVLSKYDLPYTEKDIIQNPAFRWEMEQKSGQPLSPCVEINGVMRRWRFQPIRHAPTLNMPHN
jgi:glutaredoxin